MFSKENSFFSLIITGKALSLWRKKNENNNINENNDYDKESF
jgi:hypothetical protein